MRQTQLMNVLEAPLVSEKSTRYAEKNHQVVFRVKKTASKDQVKRAIESVFSVEVETVRVLNVKGKARRFGKFLGRRPNWKKAYIKLKPGFDIDFSAAN